MTHSARFTDLAATIAEARETRAQATVARLRRNGRVFVSRGWLLAEVCERFGGEVQITWAHSRAGWWVVAGVP